MFHPLKLFLILLTATISSMLIATAWGEQRQMSYPTYFERDVRLNVQVTVPPSTLSGRQLFRIVQKATGVKILTDADTEEQRQAMVTFACRNSSARAILDAFTAFRIQRLKRTAKRDYLLVGGKETYDKAFGAANVYEEARYAAGRKFIEQMDALPRADKERLFTPDGNVVGTLPSAIQDSVKRMLDAANAGWTAKGDTNPATYKDSSKFTLTHNQTYGFNSYFAKLTSDQGTIGWEFNDYADWKRRQEAEQMKERSAPNGADPLYITRQQEIVHEQAKKMPPLQKIVEIHRTDATYYLVLRELHLRYGIPFISEDTRIMSDRENVDIPPMPLGEALDRLSQIYPRTDWEYRKYGFLIVHGQLSPEQEEQLRRKASTR